jgi:hypothetical protein
MRSPLSCRVRLALIGACAIGTGTLDLLYAFWQYRDRGVLPHQILQSIASGWLGREAYALGWLSATLGLVTHFAILAVAVALLLERVQRSSWLRRHPFTCGVAFGLVLFVVMNWVVVPLSAAHLQPLRGRLLAAALLVHVVLIGIPSALLVSRVLQAHAAAREGGRAEA